ncbi:hypothetical protein Ocin01_17509 [Orchesella cincta]|uniref:F-box domain-containing protein n=1 Tax=Orchesella cincta TaxID=48709 RepID=A0A1D2M875_ORCCI|nr:hypothetical protein Ocin01_17509 [Orchesella cincta]
MAPAIKKFKRNEAEKEDDATVRSTHTNLEIGLEENVTDVKHPRFLADTVREVWLNVFSKLDPEDKPAFFRAMPEWNAMMTTKSTQFLVPEVAPILLETLPMKLLLQSRLLSKTWTSGLDTHIVNSPAHLHLPFELAYEKSHPILTYGHKFNSTERLLRFLEKMRSHPGNPLLSGNIELQWRKPPGTAPLPELKILCLEYWNNAILLLTTFGRHALYAKIDLTSSVRLSGLELARIFHRLLDNLPSLKKLSILGTSLNHSLLIQTYFRRNPLPLLPNLELVETHCREEALGFAVINCCCDPQKMKRLKLNAIFHTETMIPEMVYNFSNLEVISMPHFWPYLSRVGNLKVVPPLREVEVDLRVSQSKFEILGEVFTSLQPFKDTLVSVNCSRVCVKRNEEGVESMIDLPNLRRLSFRFYERQLDPLVQLSGSLTHLTIFSSRVFRTVLNIVFRL